MCFDKDGISQNWLEASFEKAGVGKAAIWVVNILLEPKIRNEELKAYCQN